MSNSFIYLAKVTELSPVWEGSANSALSSVILLFVEICLSVFPFDVWDRLWILIRPVPGVSGDFTNHSSNFALHTIKFIHQLFKEDFKYTRKQEVTLHTSALIALPS